MRADEDALKNGPTMVEKAPLPIGGSLEPGQGMSSAIPPLKLTLGGGPDRGRDGSRPLTFKCTRPMARILYGKSTLTTSCGNLIRKRRGKMGQRGVEPRTSRISDR